MEGYQLDELIDLDFASKLIDFDVHLSLYILENKKNEKEVIIVGGDEVIHRDTMDYSKRIFKDLKGNLDDVNIITNRDLLPFLYVDGVNYNTDKLENLLKWKSKLKLTKTEFEGFGTNAESSALDKLEDKIVYIHEQKPSTNSLSLAKQFGLKHKHVVEDLFKIAINNPSVLTGLEFKSYVYKGGKGSVNYATYLEVSEDAYYLFLESMGTPKSQEMRVLRKFKRREYFTGFQNLRDAAYSLGFKEDELERLIGIRTEQTKRLMLQLNSYIIRYNDNVGELKVLNPVSFMRVIFNVINRHIGLDSISYSDNNRTNRYRGKHEHLTALELSISSCLKALSGNSSKLISPKDMVYRLFDAAFDLDEMGVKDYLKEYDSLKLFEEM